MDYKIIRSDRKTMGIYILKDGSVEVRCPSRLPKQEIESFVNSKEKWICKKVSEKKHEINKTIDLKANFITKFILMGNVYPIIPSQTAFFNGCYLFAPEKNLTQNLISLYKSLAKDIINEKVKNFSKIMNLKPIDVKINSAKTRWGSCSGKNSLNFTWKLIMADEKAIDYVVIHELAHCIEHNHSRKFWKIVEKYMPDYKSAQSILKTVQNLLVIE